MKRAQIQLQLPQQTEEALTEEEENKKWPNVNHEYQLDKEYAFLPSTEEDRMPSTALEHHRHQNKAD